VKIKPAGKIAGLIIILGILFGVMNSMGLIKKLFPGASGGPSIVPDKAQLPIWQQNTTSKEIQNLGMPSKDKFSGGGDQIRGLVWAWNAQMGMMFANGGAETTNGSLMASHDVNLKLTRQDDASKMQESLVEFATQLSQGVAQPNRGSHFVCIMGDGAASFLAGLNDRLDKLGPEYRAKIIGTAGFSRGEDKFMGPESWRKNPTLSKGGVVSGYLRDGDWNIAMKWLGDNNLKNNPDEKTYDPEALNWVATNDYIEAAEKYITGYSETRDVVKNGVKTGETKKIRVDAVVTWTPGDVSVASKKGGLVSIVSTLEYSAQMPCVIIAIDQWCKQNKDKVQSFLSSIFDGGNAVRFNPEALKKGAEVSTEVYKEQNASYWMRYFKGAEEPDMTGKMIRLGGSSVNDLTDNMVLFGLVPGSANVYRAVYETFGNIVVQQYPKLVSSYPPYDEVVDTSYVQDIAKQSNFNPSEIKGPAPTIDTPGTSGKKPQTGGGFVGQKVYDIKFETGRATFTSTANVGLKKLMNDTVIAGNTTIEVHGHTDNVGNADANMKLSESRAFAVKNWLEKTYPQQFPQGRISVHAHGQTQPMELNNSEGNKAKNRRVVIKIKSAG
jgi:OOP family OmpA-OmpF porin